MEVYEGRVRHEVPVTFSSIDQADRVDLPIRLESGRRAAQFHSLSWAFDVGSDGTFAHAFMQENNDRQELTLERFSAGGSLLGTTVIDTTASLSLEALALDADGTLYLSDRRELPHLRRLTWRPK